MDVNKREYIFGSSDLLAVGYSRIFACIRD